MIGSLVFLVLCLICSAISACFGFGGLILIPISLIFFPVKKAIALIAILILSTNLSKLFFFAKYADLKVVKYTWLGAVPFVFIGAFTMVYAPVEILKKLLGIVILIYVLFSVLKVSKTKEVHPLMISFIGCFYGFFTGAVASGSPIQAALMNHMGYVKEKFVGTINVCVVLLNLITTVIFINSNILTIDDIPLVIGIISFAVMGTFIGKTLINYVNPELFEKIIIVILFITGIKFLL